MFLDFRHHLNWSVLPFSSVCMIWPIAYKRAIWSKQPHLLCHSFFIPANISCSMLVFMHPFHGLLPCACIFQQPLVCVVHEWGHQRYDRFGRRSWSVPEIFCCTFVFVEHRWCNVHLKRYWRKESFYPHWLLWNQRQSPNRILKGLCNELWTLLGSCHQAFLQHKYIQKIPLASTECLPERTFFL